MSAQALSPPLPPFDEHTETLEQAVQEQMDFAAQLRFLRRQNSQLAARQDALNNTVNNLSSDVGRIADRQTASNGILSLVNSRLVSIMKHLNAPDVPEAIDVDLDF